jgi:hypothetical protein
MSTTRRACSMATAAENRTRTGVIGDAAGILVLALAVDAHGEGIAHLEVQRLVSIVATPLSAATPLPHTR